MENRPKETTSLALIIFAFAIVYVLWGSTYFFIKMAIRDIPPLLLGALRYGIAGFLMLGWAVLKRKKLFERKSLLISAIVGTLLLTGGNGAVILAEQTLPSALVAILWSLLPVTFVVIDRPNWGKNFRNRSTVLGLLMGFVGVYLLYSGQLDHVVFNSGAPLNFGGMLIVIAGTISFASGSLYSKKNPSRLSSEANVAWQMIFAGGTFMMGSLARQEVSEVHWVEIKTESWLALAFLIFFGSFVAFSAYVWLLSKRPATQVNTYAYVNPVVAVLLGVLFASEKISLLQIGGLVVILVGVLLINLSKYLKKERKNLPHVTPQKNLEKDQSECSNTCTS